MTYMNEEKNYHLITAGGLGCILTVASYGLGVWLLATGDTWPGAVLVAAASVTLGVAVAAFGRIRRNRPHWSEYTKEVKK